MSTPTDVSALTEEQRGAVSFCIAHMIDKHGYSSIVSRTHPRVDLEELLNLFVIPSAAGDEIEEGR